MPQNNEKHNEPATQAVNGIVKQHRHSLQPKTSHTPPSNLRHTQSHRYDSESKKKRKKATVLTPIPSTISEGSENESDNKQEKSEKKVEHHLFTIENEKRVSKSSKKSEKIDFAYDNGAYDGNIDKKSVSSRAGSSRQPSIQSLEVVREQYCCCAKRSKCEKKLLVTVTILTIVIIVLVIVLAIIGSHRDIGEELKKTLRQF